VPKYSQDASPVFYRRATISIDTYNLNDVRIREEREAVANKIKLQVARADKYLTRAMGDDQDAYDHFKEVVRIIQELTSKDAEFSSAARTVFAGFRDKEWVVDTLATV
jgi:hypothetical protein